MSFADLFKKIYAMKSHDQREPHFGLFSEEIINTAQILCQPGKGILAADESISTMSKRFALVDLENTHLNRQRYRQLLFETEGKNARFGQIVAL